MSGKNGIRNEICFLSFSAYLSTICIEIMSELCFWIFWIFFAIFLAIFCPGFGWNGIRNEIFSLSFLAYLKPVWIEIMLEWWFLVFWIFFPVFGDFSIPGRVGTEFETNFFFLFLGLSLPSFNTNIARNDVF